MAAVGQLDLFAYEVSDEPWGGVSPRGLTRSYKRFNLPAWAEKRMVVYVDPEQYDLWLPMKRAPSEYFGAPLLLPLAAGRGISSRKRRE